MEHQTLRDHCTECASLKFALDRDCNSTSCLIYYELLSQTIDSSVINLNWCLAELSHALYQHDAACRVIARLTKEVTAAREGALT